MHVLHGPEGTVTNHWTILCTREIRSYLSKYLSFRDACRRCCETTFSFVFSVHAGVEERWRKLVDFCFLRSANDVTIRLKFLTEDTSVRQVQYNIHCNGESGHSSSSSLFYKNGSNSESSVFGRLSPSTSGIHSHCTKGQTEMLIRYKSKVFRHCSIMIWRSYQYTALAVERQWDT